MSAGSRRPRPRAGNRITLLDWTVPVAEGWVQLPATSTMRLAEFQVPGRPADGNAEDASCTAFGQGGGGSIDDNIERWVSQFSMPDGKAVQPVVTRTEAAGMPLTTVELRGTYARGVGMGPQGAALVNHTLLVLHRRDTEGQPHVPALEAPHHRCRAPPGHRGDGARAEGRSVTAFTEFR